MSQNTVIGKVAITPQGNFQLGSIYSRLSVVSYEGSSYIAIQDNQNVPVTDTSNWYLLASKGKGISNIVLQSTVGNVSTYRVNYDDGTYYDFDIHNGPQKTSDLENNGSDGVHPFITKEVDNLTNYELKGNVGTSLEMALNNSTYVITLRLKNYAGTVLNTSTIDLPLENDIVGGSYSGGVLTLTKRNGGTVQLSFNDLVPTSRTIAGLDLTDDITADELIAALNLYTKAQVDELLVPINQRLDFIESNYDTATVSGDYIEINDSLNGLVQDPKLLGNTTQVQYTGKQLFDKDNATYSANKIIKNDQGEEVSSTASQYTTSYVSVSAETTYTIQGKINTSNAAAAIYFYDASKNWIEKRLINNSSLMPYTFTTPANCAYIQFQFVSSVYDSNTVMIELGDTAHPYEPYTGGQPSPSPDYPQDIVDVTGTQEVAISNKNQFDAEKVVQDSQPSSVKITDDGEEISYFTGSYPMIIKPYVIIPNEQYTFKVTVRNDAATSNTITFRAYYSDGTYDNILTQSISDTNYHTLVGTTTAGKTLVQLRSLYTSGKKAYIKIDGTQLELGSTATDYVPHKGLTTTLHLGDIHLRSMPETEYADRIYYENEKWWLEQKIYKVVYNGTESWSTSSYSRVTKNLGSSTKPNSSSELRSKSLSNILRNVNTEIYDGFNIGSTSIFIKTENTATTEVWTAFLAQNNMEVVYPLDKSITTEITDQTLIDDLNKLLPAQTYREHTLIQVTPAEGNTGNPAQLEVTYWKDDSIDFENRIISLENRVALLE